MMPLIEEISQNTITADDNSIYRTLNRFSEFGIVASETRPSSQGPDRRYYHLTQSGSQLLKQFTERNIRVFETPQAPGASMRFAQNLTGGSAMTDAYLNLKVTGKTRPYLAAQGVTSDDLSIIRFT
jgi:DNA-binding PadR family transcriptional regulator